MIENGGQRCKDKELASRAHSSLLKQPNTTDVKHNTAPEWEYDKLNHDEDRDLEEISWNSNRIHHETYLEHQQLLTDGTTNSASCTLDTPNRQDIQIDSQ